MNTLNTALEWIKQLSSLQAGLGGASVVLALVMLWVWLKKPDLAGISKLTAERGGARGICAWLWQKLKGLLDAINYLSTRREWRYEQPWMLMLGEQASGKSSLLRSVSPALRQVPPSRAAQLQATATEWAFFRKGVLIDPDGKNPVAEEGSSEARTWNKTLDELQALRPERPLDGLVLCISARGLIEGSQESREALAASLYRQLVHLQERIEFILPLTVVVTQCDCINGFDAFWRSQRPARRVELFGYAALPQEQSSTPREWTDSAFDAINDRLRVLQVETAADTDSIADVDGFFLFPGHFQHLRPLLRQMLESVLRSSSWQAGYRYRGLFFTGAPEAEGELREGLREDVAFADALIASRVLAEPGLALPTQNGIFSRNKLIRALQFTAIGAGIGLFVALYFSSQRVSTQVAALSSALAQLKLATPDTVRHGDCLGSESVYPLLTEVAAINHNTRYWAIPASWMDRRIVSRSDAGIEVGAIGQVLMPTLACQLENRARSISATPLRLPTEKDAEAFAKLRNALYDKLLVVRELEDNLARFDKLAERGDQLSRSETLSVLADLSLYAFGTALPPAVMNESGALSDGFGNVSPADKPVLPPRMREDLAREISRIGNAVRASLHQEVVRGADLLAALDRAEAPVLTNTRRFADWLTWAEKSWLMSTPQANPCQDIREAALPEVDTLVSRYAYAGSLWREIERFDAERCYKPEMTALGSLRQAPYGVLFAPRKPAGLELAPAVRSELGGLPALVQMSFMRMSNPRSFQCLPAGEGFRQAEVAEAAGYIKEYENFVKQMKLPPLSVRVRPLYDRLARLSLARALDDSMQRAQIPVSQSPYQQVSLETVLHADQQLAAISKELGDGLDPLLGVLRSYGDYGDPASAPLVRQCARNIASDSLSRVGALADASRLYVPTPTQVGDRMFDLGSLPVQKEFLARQVARAQVLAGYATPFMNLLQGSQSVSDTQREQSATSAFWHSSVDELNRYTQGKEPVGQVANLDNYFIKQLGDLDYSNCGKLLSTYQSPAFGNDLFSERRRQLEALVEQRCSDRRVAQAMEVYGALAQRFNRELAGRYPFADPGAPDARSGAVRQFFIDYAQQRPALENALTTLSGERWRDARQLVSQLDKISSFFASNLLAGETDNGNPIRLRLMFNAPGRSVSGSDQILAWLLSSGSNAAGIPNRASNLNWQIGESLALDLSWANRSLWAPVADPKQGDLMVEGNTATFIASQPWALLRMIEGHAVSDSASAARGQLLLNFVVPQQREVVPGKSEHGRVSLYLGMTLLGTDPKTQAEVPLRLPAKFPQRAPQD